MPRSPHPEDLPPLFHVIRTIDADDEPVNTASTPFPSDKHYLKPDDGASDSTMVSGHRCDVILMKSRNYQFQCSRKSSVIDVDHVAKSIANPLYSYYLDDGIRRIDYVLVYSRKLETEVEPAVNKTGRFGSMISEMLFAVRERNFEKMRIFRRQFEANLREEGLQLEYAKDIRQTGLRFVKVHAPWDVLCR